MIRAALAGNPNSGKSTVFNALTGARQRVGNWPGVTVERKSGRFRAGGAEIEVLDLPGTYGLTGEGAAEDELITRTVLAHERFDVIVNVVDATSLGRSLSLTRELLATGVPVVVALNMMDAAEKSGIGIDTVALSLRLGCPVVPIVAARGRGIDDLRAAIAAPPPARAAQPAQDVRTRYREIDGIVAAATTTPAAGVNASERIDRIVLHPWLAFPIFLGAMYLMFLFSINIGSAFIDLFDLIAQAVFVEVPRGLLTALSLPDWLVVLVADGVGGGVQLVATFIPVIGCMFLALAVLEDSGYMARVAFIVDRVLRRLGLPGKSFVPLIVGFGCNVPAVMATRTLDNQPDRILTTLMAPYMSCGARLAVYVLFATAFFQENGHNVVFALYLTGIAVAVISALLARRFILTTEPGAFVMELPAWHRPTLRGLVTQTWQRLQGFVTRAGKAIVVVVVVINVLNSIGRDGSVGNEDTENSLLAAIGQTITPVFTPMGIDEANWPATVGIFTGIFAKEVVVGTLDALYAPAGSTPPAEPMDLVRAGLASVPANLADLAGQAGDPLGLGDVAIDDIEQAAADQEVDLGTIGQMQNLFHGELGAFAYLMFILLYMPCVATIGAIYKEIGRFWAAFSTLWSVVTAWSFAVVCYQAGRLFTGEAAGAAVITIALAVTLAVAAFAALLWWGRRRERTRLIPLVRLD